MKTAVITGATRGIGRHIALTLAKNGYNITVAGKSTVNDPKLPGTIYSVSEEIEKLGGKSLPFKLDVRNENDIQRCIDETYHKWKSIDVLINNAGALWWKSILDTPVSKYDLIKPETDQPFEFKKGTIAFAKSKNGDTEDSEFLILLDDAFLFEGEYTPLGRVISGITALEKIKFNDQSEYVLRPDFLSDLKLLEQYN